jgi:hypothetical protein
MFVFAGFTEADPSLWWIEDGVCCGVHSDAQMFVEARKMFVNVRCAEQDGRERQASKNFSVYFRFL